MASHVPGGKYTIYDVSGNQALVGINGAYTGWVKLSDIKGYASGTSWAQGGIANINEEGLEYILGNPTKGKYAFMNDGDKVFNAQSSEFLYAWANRPAEVLNTLLKSMRSPSSVSASSPYTFSIGDIVIQGNADAKTVGDLRRARKQLMTDILTEFNKYQK